MSKPTKTKPMFNGRQFRLELVYSSLFNNMPFIVRSEFNLGEYYNIKIEIIWNVNTATEVENYHL